MKTKRKMPPKGFYVYDNILEGDEVNVIYTTGVPGGGGHKYYRPKYGSGWSTLLWTCVPGKEEIKLHTYYPELPPGIPSIT